MKKRKTAFEIEKKKYKKQLLITIILVYLIISSLFLFIVYINGGFSVE